MTRDIILALLGFSLGVLSALISQTISRRLRLLDARRKRKVEQLEKIRAWMEAWRALFHCKYPLVRELVFAHRDLVQTRDGPFCIDKTANSRVYDSLKEFHETSLKYQEAERAGGAALNRLGIKEGGWGRKCVFWFKRFILRRPVKYMYEVRGCRPVFLPKGLLGAIAPHLEELQGQEYELFQEFPNSFANSIVWDRLNFIEPPDVLSIINTRLPHYPKLPTGLSSDGIEACVREYGKYQQELAPEEAKLAEAMEMARHHRRRAEGAIERILQEIDRYEARWLSPT